MTLDERCEVSASDEKLEAVVLRICVSPGGWTVIESYCRQSVADFAVRDDALDYAISLARNRRQAVVEVYGQAGSLEARSKYASEAGNVDKGWAAGPEPVG